MLYALQVIQALDEIVRKYKRPPSIVVNSAGIIRNHYLLKMAEPEFDIVLDVNLKGAFLVMQYFGKLVMNFKWTNEQGRTQLLRQI